MDKKRRTYCSDSCKKIGAGIKRTNIVCKQNKKVSEERALKRMNNPKTCPICKKEFIPKSARETYCCPECRKIGNKEVKAAYTKRTKERQKEYNKAYYVLKSKPKREAELKLKGFTVTKEYTKVCPICNKEFKTASRLAKYCCPECKKEAVKQIQKEYRKTDKFKEYQKAYMKTEKYKAIKAKYHKTEKFKEMLKNYRAKKKLEQQELPK